MDRLWTRADRPGSSGAAGGAARRASRGALVRTARRLARAVGRVDRRGPPPRRDRARRDRAARSPAVVPRGHDRDLLQRRRSRARVGRRRLPGDAGPQLAGPSLGRLPARRGEGRGQRHPRRLGRGRGRQPPPGGGLPLRGPHPLDQLRPLRGEERRRLRLQRRAHRSRRSERPGQLPDLDRRIGDRRLGRPARRAPPGGIPPGGAGGRAHRGARRPVREPGHAPAPAGTLRPGPPDPRPVALAARARPRPGSGRRPPAGGGCAGAPGARRRGEPARAPAGRGGGLLARLRGPGALGRPGPPRARGPAQPGRRPPLGGDHHPGGLRRVPAPRPGGRAAGRRAPHRPPRDPLPAGGSARRGGRRGLGASRGTGETARPATERPAEPAPSPGGLRQRRAPGHAGHRPHLEPLRAATPAGAGGRDLPAR